MRSRRQIKKLLKGWFVYDPHRQSLLCLTGNCEARYVTDAEIARSGLTDLAATRKEPK